MLLVGFIQLSQSYIYLTWMFWLCPLCSSAFLWASWIFGQRSRWCHFLWHICSRTRAFSPIHNFLCSARQLLQNWDLIERNINGCIINHRPIDCARQFKILNIYKVRMREGMVFRFPPVLFHCFMLFNEMFAEIRIKVNNKYMASNVKRFWEYYLLFFRK